MNQVFVCYRIVQMPMGQAQPVAARATEHEIELARAKDRTMISEVMNCHIVMPVKGDGGAVDMGPVKDFLGQVLGISTIGYQVAAMETQESAIVQPKKGIILPS